MQNQKLRQILRSKSTLSEDQIEQLSDRHGWTWVYANLKPKTPKNKGAQICFTGFGIAEKDELSKQATSAGLCVVGSVTKGLTFLCVGNNPGDSKLQKAEDQNVQCLNQHEFMLLIETGELPAKK
jgi:NAD-dependent DNA ligase